MFCKRLIKWGAIGTVGVLASGYFLFGGNAFSYLRTAATSLRDGVSGQIPLEFELKRAEALIQDIEPQISDGKRQVAQAEVELENLQEEVARLERAVERGETKLRAVSAKFVGGQSVVELASYHGHRVELDLERTFETYKNNVGLLDGKRALIGRQAKAVAAARLHLDGVRSEKARLEDSIATLKTQKKQIDALATTSRHFELDDTALGQAKEVLAEVQKRLDVQQRLIEDEIYFEEGIERSDRRGPSRDIVAEIEKYFASPGATMDTSMTVPVR